MLFTLTSCSDGVTLEQASPTAVEHGGGEREEEPTPVEHGGVEREGEGSTVSPEPTVTVPEPTVTVPEPTSPAISEPMASSTALPTASPTLEVTLAPTQEPTSTPSATPTPLIWLTTMISVPGGLALPGDLAEVTQEIRTAEVPPQANMAFVFDASSSMLQQLPATGASKLAVAKQAFTELVPQVAAEANGTLWIYGHRLPEDPQEQSCQDIEQVFGLQPVDEGAYIERIQRLEAKGYTPIANTLGLAGASLPSGDNQLNSIILLSDGKETCGGDPCAVAQTLKAGEASVTTHVIGYDVDEETRTQLQCIANASGGIYSDAQSQESLLDALNTAVQAAESETSLRVEGFGADEGEIISVLLYPTGTGEGAQMPEGLKRLQSDNNNRLAPGIYDVAVYSVPPILYQGIEIVEDSSTLIRPPLATFDMRGPEGEVVRPTMYLFDEATGQIVNRPWNFETDEYTRYALVAGNYKLAIDDDKGVSGQPLDLTIAAGEQLTIEMAAFDLRAPDGQAVRPSLEVLDPTTGEQIAFQQDYRTADIERYYFLPGRYTIVMDNKNGTIGRFDDIELAAGTSMSRQLAALDLRGADGEAVRPTFKVLEQATGEEVGGIWRYDTSEIERYYLLGGTYTIVMDDDKGVNGRLEGLEVAAGEQYTIELATFDLRGANGEAIRPNLTLIDPLTGEEIGRQWGYQSADIESYYFIAGNVTIMLEDERGIIGRFDDYQFQSGQKTTIQMATFDLRDANNEPIRPTMCIIDQTTEQQVAQLYDFNSSDIEHYTIPPGSYTIELEDGRRLEDVTLAAGEMSVLEVR